MLQNDDDSSDTDEDELPADITVPGPSSRQERQSQRRPNPIRGRRKPNQQHATGKQEIFRKTSLKNLNGQGKMLIP